MPNSGRPLPLSKAGRPWNESLHPRRPDGEFAPKAGDRVDVSPSSTTQLAGARGAVVVGPASGGGPHTVVQSAGIKQSVENRFLKPSASAPRQQAAAKPRAKRKGPPKLKAPADPRLARVSATSALPSSSGAGTPIKPRKKKARAGSRDPRLSAAGRRHGTGRDRI